MYNENEKVQLQFKSFWMIAPYKKDDHASKRNEDAEKQKKFDEVVFFLFQELKSKISLD
jgi:hypothetical protein